MEASYLTSEQVAANNKKIITVVLALNFIAISSAALLKTYTDINPFRESGYITILSWLQLLSIAFLAFKIKKQAVLAKQTSAIWLIIGAGFIFLGIDEAAQTHENIDKLIHRTFNMEETNLTDRIDDALVGLYGLIGLGVLFFYRRAFIPHSNTLKFFVMGFACLFTMVFFDVITNRNDILPLFMQADIADKLHRGLSIAEEGLKIFAEAFFIFAFFGILQNFHSGQV